MCLFTLPFHAAFTDRVWDSLLFEGVHSLTQCSISRGMLAGSSVATGIADGEGIYWPTTPRRVLSLRESVSSPPHAGDQRPPEPPRYGCGMRTVVANPSGSYANKTLFKVALTLLRLAAPKMLMATSFGDALMVLDGLAVSTSKPRVHSAMFDVWVWPSESSAAAAASADVPPIKHGAVVAHNAESVANDTSDAAAVPPAAAAATASDRPGAISPPQHLRLSTQAAAEAANVAALSAVIDAHLRVSGRAARRSHRGPVALQAGAAAAASSVADSAALQDGYLVGMGFGVDAMALEWLASTSQGATTGAGRSRSNIGIGPTFGGASRSRRATGRPTVLQRQGSRTAAALLRAHQQLVQQQPRDVAAGALDCSLDDAQVDIYELAQADAGSATADPSRAGQAARIGTGARYGAPASPLASRKPTLVAPLPPRRSHPHAHWHLVPKHHQPKAPPQPSHLAKPEKVPLDGEVAGIAAGAVHAPVTPPSSDGSSSTAHASPLLPAALVLARATKPLVWREGLHVRRQWVQSRRAFLTAAAATHDAAVAAVVASIDADANSSAGSSVALVSLLHAAALHPVLEGGGGEHAPRCNVDLAAEAAAEEGTLRAEALRVRDRAAAAACKSGWSDPPHLVGSVGAALVEEAHADLGHSRASGDSEAAEEELDRDDCDRASGLHDASGLDCSSILSDSGRASDAGHEERDGATLLSLPREHDSDSAAVTGGTCGGAGRDGDLEEQELGDVEEDVEDPELERAHGQPARSVARLSDARVLDELAEAASTGLDADAGATVHLRIGPLEAAAPRRRGGGGVAAFGASPRLLLAHDPHVPPVCTARSPGGPQAEPCASSHRLWSFFYRLELDGQRPYPCGCGGPALREDYFPAVHAPVASTTATGGESRDRAERGAQDAALLSNHTLQHIFGAAPTQRLFSPALTSARTDEPTASPGQLRHGSPGSDLPIALLLMPGSDSGLGVPAQSEGRSLHAWGGGSVGAAACADPSRDHVGHSDVYGISSSLSPAHSSAVVRLLLAAAGDDAPDSKGRLKLTDRSPEVGGGGGSPSGVGSAGPERVWWADRAAVSDVAASLAEARGEGHSGGDAASASPRRPMRRVESRLLTELLPHPETPPPPCQPDGEGNSSSSGASCRSPAATPPASGFSAQLQAQPQPPAFASSALPTEPCSPLSPSQQCGAQEAAEFRPRPMTAAAYARAAAYASLPPALLGHAVLPEYLLLGGLGGSHIGAGVMATTLTASASGPVGAPVSPLDSHAAQTD